MVFLMFLYIDDGITVVRKSLIQGTEKVVSVCYHDDNWGKINITFCST